MSLFYSVLKVWMRHYFRSYQGEHNCKPYREWYKSGKDWRQEFADKKRYCMEQSQNVHSSLSDAGVSDVQLFFSLFRTEFWVNFEPFPRLIWKASKKLPPLDKSSKCSCLHFQKDNWQMRASMLRASNIWHYPFVVASATGADVSTDDIGTDCTYTQVHKPTAVILWMILCSW